MFHDVGAVKWPKGSLSWGGGGGGGRGHAPPENFEILHSRRRILSHPGKWIHINIILPFLSTFS